MRTKVSEGASLELAAGVTDELAAGSCELETAGSEELDAAGSDELAAGAVDELAAGAGDELSAGPCELVAGSFEESWAWLEVAGGLLLAAGLAAGVPPQEARPSAVKTARKAIFFFIGFLLMIRLVNPQCCRV